MTNIVITGSTKGIGAGLAKEFASQGHNVVITGRTDESVKQAIDKMGSTSGKVIGQACDVSRSDAVRSLWAFAKRELGDIDIWINNAGLASTTHQIKDTPDSDIETMITTNMLGTINGCRVAVNGMLEQGRGKLFNVLGGGSDGEFFPGMGIYGTTKRGLDYLTNALVKELKDTPVIVGKIRPGMLVTEGVIREAREDIENFNKNRRTLNIIADKVETVTPYLVEKILSTEKSGTKIAWLNGAKMAKRFMLSRFNSRGDLFEEYGL